MTRRQMRRLEAACGRAAEEVPDETLPSLVENDDGTVSLPRFDEFVARRGVREAFHRKRPSKTDSATIRNLVGQIRAIRVDDS